MLPKKTRRVTIDLAHAIQTLFAQSRNAIKANPIPLEPASIQLRPRNTRSPRRQPDPGYRRKAAQQLLNRPEASARRGSCARERPASPAGERAEAGNREGIRRGGGQRRESPGGAGIASPDWGLMERGVFGIDFEARLGRRLLWGVYLQIFVRLVRGLQGMIGLQVFVLNKVLGMFMFGVKTYVFKIKIKLKYKE